MKKIIIYLVNFVSLFFPKKSNKIVFASSPDFNDNSKQFYNFINKNYNDQFELVWIIKDQKIFENLKKEGVIAYKANTLMSFITLWTSKYIVGTHNNYISVKRPSQVYINLWHGMPLKKMGYLEEKGNLSDKQLANIKKESAKMNYLISTSEIMKLAIVGCFYIDPRKVIVSGQPRNDALFNTKMLEGINLYGIQSYSKTILFSPTFKKGFGRTDGSYEEGSLFNLEDEDLEKINNHLKDNNYLILVKLHPFDEITLKFEELSNIKIMSNIYLNENLISLNDILSQIDLLITDYSSVYFDYLLLNKPILFTDDPNYKEKRGLIFDNDDVWRPGPKVKTTIELISEMEKLLVSANYYRLERNNLNAVVNNHKDSHSSRRIFETIFNHL